MSLESQIEETIASFSHSHIIAGSSSPFNSAAAESAPRCNTLNI